MCEINLATGWRLELIEVEVREDVLLLVAGEMLHSRLFGYIPIWKTSGLTVWPLMKGILTG